MSRIAIVETATGAILVLDPTVGLDGSPILPEGVACEVVTLSDREAAKLATPDARFTVRDGRVVVERVTLTAEETARVEERQRDLALIAERAKEDPAFASLVRVVGVSAG